MPIDTPVKGVVLLLCTLALTAGCVPHVDLKRMTYETLRREDCRRNQLEDFCERTFANDYAEYEDLRRDFLRERQAPWRADGRAARP